ncbi:hypothetical protein L1887_05855 [Cichorium endivia]|nr:hypothetical protein L1887_05855 [Cichorium endivia]
MKLELKTIKPTFWISKLFLKLLETSVVLGSFTLYTSSDCIYKIPKTPSKTLAVLRCSHQKPFYPVLFFSGVLFKVYASLLSVRIHLLDSWFPFAALNDSICLNVVSQCVCNCICSEPEMYLQFYINDNGDKVYTTKKESPVGLATQSAHPARFSPDDKFSRQRVLLKKRFGLLPTQKPPKKY